MNTPFAESLWPACYSALHLDRFLLGELPASAAQELRAHLDGCARCTASLETLQKREPLPMLRVVPLRPRRWRPVLAAGAGLAAAASVLLVLRAAVPLDRGTLERSKGSGFALAMYVLHEGAVRRAAPGETVAPGDAVRFSVNAPAPGYLAVLSLDPQRHASVYFPLGERAEPIAAARDFLLPLGTRLDTTLGEEHLTALFCKTAVELLPLRAALEQGTLKLPEGCQETRWSFVKR